MTASGSTVPRPLCLPPPATLLSLPAQLVYKHDRRSRVWRVVTAEGLPLVLKQFSFPRWRQWLTWLIGLHPGQRERRRHQKLSDRGISAAPIIASGMTGGCYWLATPFVGKALYNRFLEGELTHNRPLRRQIAWQLGELTGRLLAAGFTHRDHKASNIVVDEQHQLWLIDAGSVRRIAAGQAPQQARRLLRQLMVNLSEAAAFSAGRERITRTDQLRCVRGLLRTCPQAGDVRSLMRG